MSRPRARLPLLALAALRTAVGSGDAGATKVDTASGDTAAAEFAGGRLESAGLGR